MFASMFTFPRLIQLAIDLAISAVAFMLAYFLRFDGQVPEAYVVQMLTMLPLVLSLRVFCRTLTGLHHQLWRYVSLRDAGEVTLAVTLGSICLILTARLAFGTHLPWGVLAHDWWLNLVGYVMVRVWRRMYAERQPAQSGTGLAHRVLLVGAGQAGNLVAREIQQTSPNVMAMGFVDDDRLKFRSRVQGVEVLGRTQDLPRLIQAYQVDEVILCIPSASDKDIRRILDLCKESRVKIKTMPALHELISGKVSIAKFRDIDIEDLLNRAPVSFDREATAAYVSGRVVMVTGAGGSIGAELCRQIATLGPSRLVLLGRGEFSIYTIEVELREAYPTLDIVTLIADVRDLNRLSRLFAQYSPEVVFHAAAHKHVPLMEKNPSEAIINNIIGTRVVAELADQHHVETFVLISSDKAVNPTNVMGASKRVAELVVQELATRSTTRFMSVRFGNVLGSRGSVVPLFKRQIAAGGPITLTHPDIIRYFMTIPEAVQLVLQAGALGRGGEVFVLDMGEPVKIVDLARDLIRLSGLEPDVDIKLRFTGLRPGEKLFEELLTAEEGITSTSFSKIFIASPEPVDRRKLDLGITLLQASATAGDDMAIRRSLKALVETYKYQRPGAEAEPDQAPFLASDSSRPE